MAAAPLGRVGRCSYPHFQNPKLKPTLELRPEVGFMQKSRGCYEEENRPLQTTELVLTGLGIVLGGLLTLTLRELRKYERDDEKRGEYDAV